MKSISQLNKNNAYVSSHGEKHFAEVLCLLLLFGLKFYLADITYTIDKFCNLFTEIFDQMFLRSFSILDNIMQNCGRDALGIKAHAREDTCNF